MIRVPVILGPTAVGKTAVSLALARRHGLEVISCDSRQVYRFMDIGTAKPTRQERMEVPHWLIDMVEPDRFYSAHDWADAAERVIRERHEAGRRVLVVGGSGFYFRSLSAATDTGAPADTALRAAYEEKVREEGAESIFRELVEVDSRQAQKIHPNDTRRIIRALEVFRSTGRKLSDFTNAARPRDGIEFHTVVLNLPRPALYARIGERTDRMLSSGLWEEFCGLVARGYDRAPGMLCVGYRELFDVRDGVADLQTAAERIKQNTRRFAKRQMTWFRHQTPGVHIDISECPSDDAAAERLGRALGIN